MGDAAELEVVVGQKWSSPSGERSYCYLIYSYHLLFHNLLSCVAQYTQAEISLPFQK